MLYYQDSEITIRDIRAEDITYMFSWWIDKELNKHDPRPLPYDSTSLLKECQSFCGRFDQEIMNPIKENRKYHYFIICDNEDCPIGFVNFFGIDKEKKDGEMGVEIGDKRYWKRGIAYRAINAAVDFIFSSMDIERIHIETGETNIPAQRLFAKAGFLFCGEYMDEDFKFIVMEKLKDSTSRRTL